MKINATMNVYCTIEVSDVTAYVANRKELLGVLDNGQDDSVLELVKTELRIALHAISGTCPFTVLFELDEIEEDESN